MVLVVGSMSSGKLEYVTEQLGYLPESIADGVIDERKVVCNVQDIVRRQPEKALSLLPELLSKEVVICNEVGSGIIPVDPQERLFREQTGRLCILLAQHADKVVRMVSGIATVIKGE